MEARLVGSGLGEDGVLTVVLAGLGCPVGGLVLCGWDEPEFAVEASVVEPVDVLGDRELEIADAVPRAAVADQFALEQRVERLGCGIDAPIAVK